MTRNRLVLIGLVALLLAGFISVQMYRVLNHAVTQLEKNTPTTIVAAANAIPAGVKLSESDLRLLKMPQSEVPAGAFRSVSEVVGRAVTTPLAKGDFVLAAKLAGPNAGSGLPVLIPPGMRAVSVKVNDVISVAGFVTAGTRVDVLLTGQPAMGIGGDPAATTVLENVQVLAAGQKLQGNSQGDPQQATVITLLVSPEDAQKLALATQEGKIQLALRNPLDEDSTNVSAISNRQLYGMQREANKSVVRKEHPTPVHALKPAPPKTPEKYVVEVYRGHEVDKTSFDQQKDAQ
jgi:pilus assembly protein CpaB